MALLTAVLLLATLIPMSAAADEAIQTGVPGAGDVTVGVGDRLDTNDNGGPDLGAVTKVGFNGMTWAVIGYYPQGGTYESNTTGPVGNGVVTAADMPQNAMTLLLDTSSADMSSGIYFNTNGGNVYAAGTLYDRMNNEYSYLADKEKNLVIKRTLANNDYQGNFSDYGTPPYFDNVNGTSPVADASYWPLSTREAAKTAHAVRAYNNSSYNSWWLRSPGRDRNSGEYHDFAAYVDFSGNLYPAGAAVTPVWRVARPAFNLNLGSVIFTSAAVGGKSGAADASLAAATAVGTAPIKFTVSDAAIELASITPTAISRGTISFAYVGRTAGTTLSAIVTDSAGTVKYYGKLDTSASTSGSADVTLPAGFDPATNSIRIFAEEINGDCYTDFAGTPIEIGFAGAAAPRGLTALTPTAIANNDGRITGVDGTMEYKLSSASGYSSVSGAEITGLAPGSYDVRYRAETISADGKVCLTPSAAKSVTVGRYTEPSGPGGDTDPNVPGDNGGNNPDKTPAHASSKAKVKFDANGGSIGKAKTKTITVRTKKSIGKLPTTKRSKYKFTGWYTKKTGGVKISAKTKVKKATTFYAHWKKLQRYGMVVKTAAVYVRYKPSLHVNLSPVIGYMKAGTIFKIRGFIKLKGRNNSWYVRTWKNHTAYVHAKYVKVVYK